MRVGIRFLGTPDVYWIISDYENGIKAEVEINGKVKDTKFFSYLTKEQFRDRLFKQAKDNKQTIIEDKK